MTPNQRAFLDMIAVSEIGANLLAHSDNGYNVIVGGSLFHDYSDHPRRLVRLNSHLSSTAAGRYQLLARYFDTYKRQLGLKDFGHEAQDAIALQQIRECRAMEDIELGLFASAVQKCSRIWASLPGAQYGQHTNELADLQVAYLDAGGTLA